MTTTAAVRATAAYAALTASHEVADHPLNAAKAVSTFLRVSARCFSDPEVCSLACGGVSVVQRQRLGPRCIPGGDERSTSGAVLAAVLFATVSGCQQEMHCSALFQP
ncbi:MULTISPECIES: hypothetical protein [unclassified Streptomyces]|uniref:hypothetical protein n=1 Tax=unclassified Streptomyces TaxID=2593676 RepID=UPI0011B93646|nr:MULTISPECIES: hypothetical protein [unclassified Streptomyces]MYX67287.1 hypothetical protein [Streptomyces sp. SID8373]